MSGGRRMVCGNDPTAQLTPEDEQAIADFIGWLKTRGPNQPDTEPIPAGPDAARTAAQRLSQAGAHVHLVASGGIVCMNGCQQPGQDTPAVLW